MSFFKNLAQLNTFSQLKPFPALRSIKWRADQILKNRTPVEVENTATEINTAIDGFKEERIAEETENYISRLYENGGWELDYLDRNASGTKSDIRDLINNWPSYADDKPDIPSVDDISDLEALQEILCSGYTFHGIAGFPAPQVAELYAVLALMMLDYAVRWLYFSGTDAEGGKPLFSSGAYLRDTQRAINAANLIIEATEIVCYAERELSDARLRELRHEQRLGMTAEIKEETRMEQARAGARAKHAKSNEARIFAVSEWRQHRDAYDRNKSAFARIYVKRVFNEYGVTITEKQMREVWLSDTPSAGSPAGVPAGG